MTGTVKKLFNLSTLGLFSSPDVEGPSEAELSAQQKQRRDEEQEQAELLSKGPTRTTGRSRKIGRQLLSFLGPSATKTTTGTAAPTRSGGPIRRAVNGRRLVR